MTGGLLTLSAAAAVHAGDGVGADGGKGEMSLVTNWATSITEELRGHRTWFLILGLVLIAVGIVALAYDVLTTIVSVLIFGWLLLIGGIIEVVHAF